MTNKLLLIGEYDLFFNGELLLRNNTDYFFIQITEDKDVINRTFKMISQIKQVPNNQKPDTVIELFKQEPFDLLAVAVPARGSSYKVEEPVQQFCTNNNIPIIYIGIFPVNEKMGVTTKELFESLPNK